MASNSNAMDELKQSLRSIIISSRSRLSIEELRKDYYTIEGRQLPYKRFGFNSVIELIQNMSDTFSIPSNPKEYSLVSLVGETKSDHLIQLIANQKPNTKRGKPRRSENRNSCHNNSSHNTNYYNRSKSTSRPSINHTSQPLTRSKSFYSEDTNKSFSYSDQNDIQKPKSSFVSHVSDAPNTSLKLSGINNSKQFANGNHSINNKFTTVLNKIDDETSSITNKPTRRINDFVNKCKVQTMLSTLKDSNCNKNSMAQIKSKIDYIKRQAKIRQDINDKLKNSSGIESHDSSANADMCKSKSVSFAHSTPKKNYSDDIKNVIKSSNMIQFPSIPEDILWKIAMVFRAYYDSMNYILFSFVYMKMHHSKFEPKNYGFNSSIEFFKHLDQHYKVRNNVVYKNTNIPNYNELIKTENWSNTQPYINSQNKIISIVLTNNNEHISLHLHQTLVHDDSEIAMVLSEVYFPSLFFMQLCSKREDFNILIKQMESFYDEANIKYCVEPEHVLVGSCYATSYTESVNKWRRVKILCEVNSTHVQVIQVDYGTMNCILKKNLRFLKKEFCDLQCQAIQCCLAGFNEIDKFEENVTIAFSEMIHNNTIMVKIDKNIILNNQNQVLHVTLFKKSKNINSELVIWYM
ncbi:OST-HTH/LOTUS domain,Tudor domain [Cinara cedri]|uniref:OST-HTH/LOTUS domain,Tudor domain n=1 Tax=Cinara cedri TaxID=506608 RepID=A0A5E4N8G9_9HEMI|nr:OST-HTH/LOTUS domain,Tudor domain [Cinara cedri]